MKRYADESVEGVIVHASTWVPPNIKRIGAVRTLRYLTPKDYRFMLQRFTKWGNCPTGWLNDNQIIIDLVVEDDIYASKIQNMTIGRGQIFTLKGFPLVFDWQEFPAGAMHYPPPSKNTDQFLVKSIQFEGKIERPWSLF